MFHSLRSYEQAQLTILDEHPGNHKVTLKVRAPKKGFPRCFVRYILESLLLPLSIQCLVMFPISQVHVPHLDLDPAQTEYLATLAGNVSAPYFLLVMPTPSPRTRRGTVKHRETLNSWAASISIDC